MPRGIARLVAAAIVGAIMSTISGLVNSTSTIVTLDIVQRGWGRDWSEAAAGARGSLVGRHRPADRRPVRAGGHEMGEHLPLRPGHLGPDGRAGGGRVPLWCVVERRRERGALACLWLAVLTVPLTLVRAILADVGVHFLPPTLENPLVLAGAISLICWVLMGSLCDRWSPAVGWSLGLAACVPILGVAVWSPTVTALLVAAAMLVLAGWPLVCRSQPCAGLWDQSLLRSGTHIRWYASVGTWWLLLAAVFAGIYAWFW